ncbi:unnamed protein product [Lactuca saligna]|uniref:Uncharacterized protein n=1 Tax=Lactuca saligna TaxID=75948 RepID=A0AA35VPS8_LACSI|nr:unnamed protein product [Lactuca saligna]
MVPVKKHLGYLISYEKYVKDMDTKMRELNATRRAEEDHLNTNTRFRRETSLQVKGWLEEVEKIEEKVKCIHRNVYNCCSLKIRHTIGQMAFEIIEEIDSVTRQHSQVT